MTDLNGKIAVITGASRGIGRAIALKCAGLGCDVAFSYLKNKEAADKLSDEIKKLGVRCSAQKVDIRDFSAVKSWINGVKEEFSEIDILVNNAGIIQDKALMMMTENEWRDVIDTDLNGMFNSSRACIVPFMKQKKGHIINISSVSGSMGLPGQTNYSAAKGGVNAFTKSLAKEVAAFGIRVNAIAPGFIETDILNNFSEDQKKDVVQSIPLARIGSPEDVANCVAFLLSDEAQYITGQVIHVDGGLAIR